MEMLHYNPDGRLESFRAPTRRCQCAGRSGCGHLRIVDNRIVIVGPKLTFHHISIKIIKISIAFSN